MAAASVSCLPQFAEDLLPCLARGAVGSLALSCPMRMSRKPDQAGVRPKMIHHGQTKEQGEGLLCLLCLLCPCCPGPEHKASPGNHVENAVEICN
jgi:hypothetical protein